MPLADAFMPRRDTFVVVLASGASAERRSESNGPLGKREFAYVLSSDRFDEKRRHR